MARAACRTRALRGVGAGELELACDRLELDQRHQQERKVGFRPFHHHVVVLVQQEPARTRDVVGIQKDAPEDHTRTDLHRNPSALRRRVRDPVDGIAVQAMADHEVDEHPVCIGLL
jgi:hypothetical protein